MKITFICLLAFSFRCLVRTESTEDECTGNLIIRLKFLLNLNVKILELQEEVKEYMSKGEPTLQICSHYTSKEFDSQNFNEIMQMKLLCLEFTQEYRNQLRDFRERANEMMNLVLKSNKDFMESAQEFCRIEEVHAFVKRDAPAPAPAKAADTNYLEDLQKQFGDFSKQLNDKFRDTFNAEEINKGFSNAVNSVNKAFADLKPTSEPKKD